MAAFQLARVVLDLPNLELIVVHYGLSVIELAQISELQVCAHVPFECLVTFDLPAGHSDLLVRPVFRDAF